MRILAIETSCDETACAVVDVAGGIAPQFTVRSNVISSQVKLHAPYGGVVPTLASREHLNNIPRVFKKALKDARTNMEDIDAIAVTCGPGLVIALLIGVNFARGLAYAYGKKIIPVHHVAGHIYSNWLSNEKLAFPLLNIVVSGGHTELILMKRIGAYALLGETRDDAAGEAFDKTATLLGLGYPGGPAIAACAKKGDPARFALPRPMLSSGDYDFSFSGLKTAVIRCIQKYPEIVKNKTARMDFCASFEQAVADVITEKTIRAAQEHRAKTVALSGGVSANRRLRKQLASTITARLNSVSFITPLSGFSTDNAAMIAAAAYFHRTRATSWKNIDASAHTPLASKML